MKILRLLTHHWGSLEDRGWEFADTVLLTGESGSGKSTLLDAIQTLLTAAHHHVVQFNVGQDESTQSRRGGKEPRSLQAYALGQQADGVFLRPRSTSYLGLVFGPSPAAQETAAPFSVLVGVEAYEDAGRAMLSKCQFFIIRREVSLALLMQRKADTLAPQAWPLKELYLQLQHQLGVGPEGVQRFDDKSSYLSHLYGAMMGKTAVAELEAFRAAKSLVKAMAYKELGNVNDLVRDEILEAHDFSRDLDKMRELMRAMVGLKAEAERQRQNIERLEQVAQAAAAVLEQARRFVQTRIAQAMRAVDEAEGELESLGRQISAQQGRHAGLQQRLEQLRELQAQLGEQLDLVKARLAASDVSQRKTALESEVRALQNLFRQHWAALQQAASGSAQMTTQLQQLLALDLSAVPALAAAVAAFRPAAQAVLRAWPALAQAFAGEAALDADLPAFDLESFDADLQRLRQGIHGHEESMHGALVAALAQTQQTLGEVADQQRQRDAELRSLQAGRSPVPEPVRAALELLEQELPRARAHILCQLVEPRPGTLWQAAIEGYMGGDRFALIVEAGFEASATRLVKRRFPLRSPKVVQGSKALADTEGRSPEARAVLHELVCTHPVAQAFLLAQYGRVRKVEDEDELARTAQGLMQEGVGSRGYGMFSCRLGEQELAFGAEARQRRMRWCEQELQRLAALAAQTQALQRSLGAISRMFSGAGFTAMAPLLEAVLASQLQHAHAAQSLAALDLSSIVTLEQERLGLLGRLQEAGSGYDQEMRRVGELDLSLRELRQRERSLGERLPQLQQDREQAQLWAQRFERSAPGQALASQLLAEARELADTPELSQDAMRLRIGVLHSQLPNSLRELHTHVFAYLSAARNEQERFAYQDPPRSFDRLEELLPPVLGLQVDVAEQLRRQRQIGLAENLARLQEAEAGFNSVFTTSFCFKVRDDIRQGAQALQKLNRELRSIQFGSDRYELDWAWVPRLQKVFEFFEAMEALVDSFEKEPGSIFDSPRLSDEHRATAQEIRRLLLAQDQGTSERALREMADYRNYRRYDIIRHSPVGQTKLSTWGTGSGGELETPFYVIRSAVLAHALGHFGRERRGAPALRLMLSDEAFSKMDESRSRSVLQFLSGSLGLQLIVAMPTSKSGAVKPEFEKEFTFSKLLAQRGGKELFISEVQEKTLHKQALAQLWAEHAARARETARQALSEQAQRDADDAPA